MSKSKYNRFEKDLAHGFRFKNMYMYSAVQCRGFLDKTQLRITIIQLNSMALNMFLVCS